MATSGLIRAEFAAINGSGSINVPGLLAGDVVISLVTASGSIDDASSFEHVISVDGEIQQLGGTLSGVQMKAFVLR